MRIDRSEKIADQPLLRVRNFLRRAGRDEFSKRAIAEHFSVSVRKAAEILREMKRRSWVEDAPPFKNEPMRGWYKVASAGLRLAAASAIRPISRARLRPYSRSF